MIQQRKLGDISVTEKETKQPPIKVHPAILLWMDFFSLGFVK